MERQASMSIWGSKCQDVFACSSLWGDARSYILQRSLVRSWKPAQVFIWQRDVGFILPSPLWRYAQACNTHQHVWRVKLMVVEHACSRQESTEQAATLCGLTVCSQHVFIILQNLHQALTLHSSDRMPSTQAVYQGQVDPATTLEFEIESKWPFQTAFLWSHASRPGLTLCRRRTVLLTPCGTPEPAELSRSSAAGPSQAWQDVWMYR